MADGNQVKGENTTPQKPGAASPAPSSGGPKPLMNQGGGRGGFFQNRGGRGGGHERGGGRGGGMSGPMRGGRGGGMRGGRGGQGGGGGGGDGPGQRGGMGGSNMSLDQAGQGGGGGGGNFGPMGRGKARTPEERAMEKLTHNFNGPTTDIPARETAEGRKFSGHCRLYVGNVPNDITDEEFVALFTPFGETNEHFINRDKMFAFIKMDYRSSAERAKNALDQTIVHGKNIKVRYAQHGAIVKVKNLSPFVSNELLEKAFSVFGEVEKAIVAVDARGKAQGEGVVEFVQKPAAQTCFKMLSEGCFFLTSSPKPVICELVTEQDDEDGMMEKNLPKRHHEYQQERELPPRFAQPESFEFEYGQRWKELNELEKQKLEAVKAEMRYEREKLESQMEYAKQDAEINLLRKQLRQRELEKEERMRKQEMSMRHLDEARKREEALYREREGQMTQIMTRREESMRQRAQENCMFLQQEASFAGGEGAGPGYVEKSANGANYAGEAGGRGEGSFAAQGGYEWEQGQGMALMEQGNYGGGKFGPDAGGQGLAGAGPGMAPGRQWGRGPGDRGPGNQEEFQAKRRRF